MSEDSTTQQTTHNRTYSADLFAGGSEMGDLMRSHDWTKTPLGAIETWPQSLKTAIRIILGSRYPMFIWWGQEMTNLYNDAYIPVLGRRHPTALGRSAGEIWTDIWEIVGPQAEAVLHKGESSWNEELLEIMERNGYSEETYFTFSYSPIGNDDGSVGGVFCACTEDTRRVVDDRRLRTLRKLGAETAEAKTADKACQICTSAFSNNPHDIPFALIYLLDSDRQHARLVSTTGLAVGTPASPAVVDFSAATDSSDRWSLGSVLATGKSQVVENAIERFGLLPGGAWERSPNSAMILPLTRPGQTTLGFLIVGINPFGCLNEDYRGFFELVAGQVTLAIANARAYEEECQRSEDLTELDRAKTAFFNNVSHEFRTPLTLMLSPVADALADRDNPLAPEQQERLQVFQRNGLRLLKLVNTLLDFSRIESDRISAVCEPTDLATLTAELASVFRAAIEKANLRLTVDCPPLAEPIYVDREMWEKIVLNLLSNAFKFTFEGEIAVRLHQVGDRVELTVQDTGIGIHAAEIPRLFERFHRVPGAKGRTFEGSGIGLSLVQELVKLHGGTVRVSSLEGEGSCFTVSIPTGFAHLPPERTSTTRTLSSTVMGAVPYIEEALRWLPEVAGEMGRRGEGGDGETGRWGNEGDEGDIVGAGLASNRSRQTNDISTKPAPTLQSLIQNPKSKILLVDDNADLRDYARRLLSDRWQVETAANGAIALQLIRQQQPDLVLSDVMMPELDGLQLLQALRSDPLAQSLPVILLSARAGEEAMIEGLEAGANDYLIKPFSARELIARIETQLQMSRLRQEQSANRFKDEFLLTLTHELQAPLVAILGWVRLLQSQSFDRARMARALATIERNATNEAKLVKDLLDVSSILSGQCRLQPQFVDLVSLMQNLIATLREAAEAKNLQLVETISNSARGTVLTDGDRLRQIITILLDNAIKFTPEGGQIDIQLDRFGWEIQIVVTDTGIGIRPDFLPYVFDRFTQAEVPSRYSPGGVGLGLAIARLLVELHGGAIEAASEGEGRGATFTVKLPLMTSAAIQQRE